MELTGRLTTSETVRAFMLAGNATLTLKSLKSGTHFTYKVRKADDDKKDLWFVSLLRGSDNDSNFVYMGIIRDDQTFAHTRKSRVTEEAPSFKAFAFLCAFLAKEQLPTTLEVWHEGKCGRCGRKLTVPESVASGFGPECLGKISAPLAVSAPIVPNFGKQITIPAAW